MTRRFFQRLALAIAADIAFVAVAQPDFCTAFVFGFLMGIWVGLGE